MVTTAAGEVVVTGEVAARSAVARPAVGSAVVVMEAVMTRRRWLWWPIRGHC